MQWCCRICTRDAPPHCRSSAGWCQNYTHLDGGGVRSDLDGMCPEFCLQSFCHSTAAASAANAGFTSRYCFFASAVVRTAGYPLAVPLVMLLLLPLSVLLVRCQQSEHPQQFFANPVGTETKHDLPTFLPQKCTMPLLGVGYL